MAFPRGFIKNINISNQKVGFARRQELLDDIADQGTFLPRGVHYVDIDGAFIEMVNKDMSIVVDGKKIPVLFLSIQKWSEFSKTWMDSDEYKNIKMPFITVVRVNKMTPGTNQAGNWNEVGIRKYSYMKIPTFEGGRRGVDVYKIPQPTSVDIDYEVRLFCNRMKHINDFNETIQKLFQSRQHYIYANNHPMPVHLETISDESKIDEFDKRKFYVQKLETKLLGYILDENDFEIVPTVNRLVLNEEIIQPKVKTRVEIKKKGDVKTLNYYFVIKPKTNNRFDFKAEYDTKFTEVTTSNISSISFKVNGISVGVPFVALAGDIINVRFDKDFYESAEFELNGIIL